MADPVLLPPTPVIHQADSPEEIARVTENMQKMFDKVSPKIRGTATPEAPPEPPKPTVPSAPDSAPETEPTTPVPEEKPPDKSTPSEGKIPSFIEKALEVPEVKSPTEAKPETTAIEDWPEELPPKEKQSRIQGLREEYKKLKKEAEQLRSRPAMDEKVSEELQFLRNRSKEMETQLSRLGVEQHQEFQQKIVAPMQQAWNEAARIVHEAGGDPNDLAKALSFSGKAQYEALDQIFEGMPESAKIEANEAIRSYKRLDESRRRALADAPRTAEALKKADMERQYQYLNQQKEEMKTLFDNAVAKLRDEAKVEVLQKANDPEAKFWNAQADDIVDAGRKLFLENTDMSKVAFALALAPMVDVYRKLWLTERAERTKANKTLKEKFGSEPSISESGGNQRGGPQMLEEDLKKPFTDVFLREFHKARGAGVR